MLFLVEEAETFVTSRISLPLMQLRPILNAWAPAAVVGMLGLSE